MLAAISYHPIVRIHLGPLSISPHGIGIAVGFLIGARLMVPAAERRGITAEQVYAHVKRAFLKHRKADAIYLLGTGWRVLPIIDLLEQDLGVPVVHPVPARCWEIQLRLSVRQPVKGYGRLLAEMIAG